MKESEDVLLAFCRLDAGGDCSGFCAHFRCFSGNRACAKDLVRWVNTIQKLDFQIFRGTLKDYQNPVNNNSYNFCFVIFFQYLQSFFHLEICNDDGVRLMYPQNEVYHHCWLVLAFGEYFYRVILLVATIWEVGILERSQRQSIGVPIQRIASDYD